MTMVIRRDSNRHERRRGRNLGVLIVLIALVALLFAVTTVKLGPNAANPSAGQSWGTSLIEWLRGDDAAPAGRMGQDAGAPIVIVPSESLPSESMSREPVLNEPAPSEAAPAEAAPAEGRMNGARENGAATTGEDAPASPSAGAAGTESRSTDMLSDKPSQGAAGSVETGAGDAPDGRSDDERLLE